MPAYRDSAQNSNSGSGSTTTVTVPATVQPGDLLILLMANGGGAFTNTAPSGWTAIPNTRQAVTNDGVDAWSKVAVAADAGSTVTVTTANGTTYVQRILYVLAYSGAQVGNAASHEDTTASTSHTAPTAVANSASAWVLNLFMDRASPGSTSFVLPSNLTQRQFLPLSGGAAPSAVAADQANVGTGSVGGNTVTGTVSTGNACEITIVLEPALTVTASANPNTNVSGWATVTLTGTTSEASSSITSSSWACDDASVVIASPSSATTTAVVPAQIAAHTYTFTFAATDSSNNTAKATCTVGVAPATVRYSSGGVMKPCRIKQISAS